MTRLRRGAAMCVGAGLAFLAAPLAAQSEVEGARDGALRDEALAASAGADQGGAQTDRQRVLPGAMSADQLIVFLTAFSETDEMARALDGVLDQLLQKGEKITDWQDQGVDIIAELSSRDGGLENNHLRDVREDALSITDLSGTANPDLSGFASYALRPDPVGLVAERGFTSFRPGIWFEIGLQRTQKGNALCHGGYFGVTLHSARPHAEWSQDELIAIATIFAFLDRLSALDICTVYSMDQDGRFTTRGFLSDGTDLPALNAEPDPSVVITSEQLNTLIQRNTDRTENE